MSRYQGPFPTDIPECTGVLLVNLGTPDQPTTGAVRRYLKEFLSDPRVVEVARPIWWLVLHGIILRTRPRRSAANYRKVWGDDGSPLLAISRRQQLALQQQLDESGGGPYRVQLAMRYGNPGIADALQQLRAANARRIIVLQLYPQYSATTTASTFDQIGRVLRHWRWIPELRLINHYHDLPGYIEAVAGSIRRFWQKQGRPERLLISFHGIPQAYESGGDPYPDQCRNSAALLAGALQLDATDYAVSFQSRMGGKPWVRPYTDETLKQWAADGVRSVQVVCPGFPSDCLETLEEIGHENRDYFLQAGGSRFDYIPALNDHPEHIQMLASLVQQHRWTGTPDENS